METKDERWKSVAYFSKLLNKTECNYEIHNEVFVDSNQEIGGIEAFVRRH